MQDSNCISLRIKTIDSNEIKIQLQATDLLVKDIKIKI